MRDCKSLPNAQKKIYIYIIMFRKTALLICDLQTKVIPHIKNSKTIIKNTKTLIQANKEYRNLHYSEPAPIICAELLSRKLGPTIPTIASELPAKNLLLIEKNTYSMYDDSLSKALKEDEIDTVLLTGVQTEWCINRTADDFYDNGFNVIICSDAVGSTDETEHAEAICRMKRKHMFVTTSHSFIVSRLKHVDNPISRWYLNWLKQKDNDE